MHLVVTGWSVLCSTACDADGFVAAITRAEGQQHDVASLYEEPLPSARAPAMVGFNVTEILGRKGTSAIDRRTALALVAYRDVLSNGAVLVDDSNRHRIGVTIGTTWGSLKAMSDYTKESLLEDRPYLVNALGFPNTVMNCAAGYVAIRYGLKGVNATIAGGPMAFLNVLEYTSTILQSGYADIMLAGSVEEFTPHTAWAQHLTGTGTPAVAAGEAAVVYVIERGDAVGTLGGDRRIIADVLAVASGFAPGGVSGRRMHGALEGCIRRALARANVSPTEIAAVAISGAAEGEDDGVEHAVLMSIFGTPGPERTAPRDLFGECYAANGGLQLGALLAWHRGDPRRDGAVSLMINSTCEGGVGAAVIRGWNRCPS
jgi:3-oxoacyl-[acyl-carrier-protein] synthase II